MNDGGEKKDLSEIKISGKTHFVGDILQVEKDVVRLPDGGQSMREWVRHPGAAVILPLLDETTVLLEWQFRYPMGRHFWEIPAGKVDAGEKPAATAKRELLEETGYEAVLWEHIMSIDVAIGYSDERAELFLARRLQYKGHPGEADEFVEVFPTPFEKAFAMLDEGEITDAKTVIGLMWLRQKYGA